MPALELAFQKFLAGLDLPREQADAARERGRQVNDFLKRELKAGGVLWGGSFRRGTYLGFSGGGIKLHVVVNPKYYYECQKNSRKLLNLLRHRLAGEYAETGMIRDGQALALKFPTPPDIHLVPSIRLSDGNLMVPNGIGGWYKTNPARQEKVFNSREESSGGEFKSLVKIIKAWNIHIHRLFTPYYLELLVYYRVSDSRRTYGEYLASLFRSMRVFLPEFLSCPAVRDPVSLGDLEGVRPRIEEAFDLSERALGEKDPGAAAELWKCLLGGKFGENANPGR